MNNTLTIHTCTTLVTTHTLLTIHTCLYKHTSICAMAIGENECICACLAMAVGKNELLVIHTHKVVVINFLMHWASNYTCINSKQNSCLPHTHSGV